MSISQKWLGIVSVMGAVTFLTTQDMVVKWLSGDYPLSRYLYVYVNKKPGEPLPPLEREFMRLVLSKTGQDTVIKDGYIAVSPRLAQRERRKLD